MKVNSESITQPDMTRLRLLDKISKMIKQTTNVSKTEHIYLLRRCLMVSLGKYKIFVDEVTGAVFQVTVVVKASVLLNLMNPQKKKHESTSLLPPSV